MQAGVYLKTVVAFFPDLRYTDCIWGIRKSGPAALTHAPEVSFAGKVWVNTISPGWIDTAYTVYDSRLMIYHGDHGRSLTP